MLVYFAICGQYPFKGDSPEAIFSSVKNKDPQFGDVIWNEVSHDCSDFVRICLTKDPKKRPSSVNLLKHPWVSQVTRKVDGDCAEIFGTVRERMQSLSVSVFDD